MKERERECTPEHTNTMCVHNEETLSTDVNFYCHEEWHRVSNTAVTVTPSPASAGLRTRSASTGSHFTSSSRPWAFRLHRQQRDLQLFVFENSWDHRSWENVSLHSRLHYHVPVSPHTPFREQSFTDFAFVWTQCWNGGGKRDTLNIAHYAYKYDDTGQFSYNSIESSGANCLNINL
jgi:hypothetical protein